MKKYSVLGMLLIVGVLMLDGVAYADLNDGLVAYYPFNGNANDASGNGNDGIEHGGVTYINAVNGMGLKLNGVNSAGGTTNPDFIKVPNNSTLQFENELTIAYFAKIDGSQAQTSANCSGDAINGISGTILAKSGDRSGFYFNESEFNTGFGINHFRGGEGLGVGDLTTIYQNFRHVSYVVHGDNIKIFIDGELVETGYGTIDFSLSNNEDLYIGVQNNGSGSCLTYWYPLDGVIDDMYIYNRALSEPEIQELYSGQSRSGEFSQADMDAARDAGYQSGRQACITSPSSCGINLDGDYNPHTGAGTVSSNLDIHMPSLNYHTLFGTQNIWVDFEFYGEGQENAMLWKLKAYGVNE